MFMFMPLHPLSPLAPDSTSVILSNFMCSNHFTRHTHTRVRIHIYVTEDPQQCFKVVYLSFQTTI
jgi:hypothetical protein